MAKVTQAHIDARTKDILDAAMRTFARKGVESTTMQEIAAEADLSAGAIYRYFPSKDHLLRGVFADCTEENREKFEQASAGTDSPCAAIGDIGRSAWGALKREGARQSAILNLETVLAAARKPEELGAARREMLSAQIELLSGLVRQAQAVGEIDTSVDAQAIATTLLAAYLGSSLLALELGEMVDTDAVCDVMTGMLQTFASQAQEPLRRDDEL
jgi:AcrR family transcriptional regulator